jgi:type IV pilus assembly protein PilW
LLLERHRLLELLYRENGTVTASGINSSMKGINCMRRENGFTLVELLIAMAISVIFMTAVYMNFRSQHDSYTVQDQAVVMEQNLRAGMYFIQKGIRMAGFDPAGNVDDPITVADSDSIIFNRQYTESYRDLNNDGTRDAGEAYSDFNRNLSYDSGVFTIEYRVDPNDLLVTDGGGGPLTVAENIQAIGFAYAFDNSPLDGELDMDGGNIIWAIDTNADGDLDLNLDTNNDGVIDAVDDTGNDGTINGRGIPGGSVDYEAIRAVRVWLLARAQREDTKFYNDTDYVVSDRRITPNDGFRRELLTMDIKCRNMGL